MITNQLGTESSISTMFHKFLRDLALIAPSTFSHFHNGPSKTHLSNKGYSSRIDYIVCSRSILIDAQSAVETDLALGLSVLDHHPVSLKLTCSLVPEKPCASVNPRLNAGFLSCESREFMNSRLHLLTDRECFVNDNQLNGYNNKG